MPTTTYLATLGFLLATCIPAPAQQTASNAPPVAISPPVAILYTMPLDCGATEMQIRDASGRTLYFFNKPFTTNWFLSSNQCSFTPDMTCSVQISPGSPLDRTLRTALPLDRLVAQIVTEAGTTNIPFFAPHMDQAYKGRETDLIGMINQSGMPTNYLTRYHLETNGTARLDYHLLERGCNFQIDLAMTNGDWNIRRIWFCR
jgi:hypothetical protein